MKDPGFKEFVEWSLGMISSQNMSVSERRFWISVQTPVPWKWDTGSNLREKGKSCSAFILTLEWYY